MNTLESKPLLNGRGNVVFRNGRPRPLRYSEVKPRQRLVYGDSSSAWSAVSNCSASLAAITTPEGNSETLLKFTASGANVNSFYDYVFPSAIATAKYQGFWIDIYVTRPTTSATAGTGSSGINYTFTFSVGSMGSANFLSCVMELTWGWNRVFIGRGEFTAGGTGNWDTSSFFGFRSRLGGTTGHTHSVWIREIGWF